jgi:hypothetical protein
MERIIQSNRTTVIIILIMSIMMVEGGLMEEVKVNMHSIIITTIIDTVDWIGARVGGINHPRQVMADVELYDLNLCCTSTIVLDSCVK